jgi:CRISPR-associated protein Cas1
LTRSWFLSGRRVNADDGEQEPLPISLVVHHVFCPRRAWLEAAGESTDTYQMAVGTADHSTADDPDAGRPNRMHSVEVVHREWGLSGRCDTVERRPDGSLIVIEHKATPVRRRPDLTEGMRVQLALQVESLRSMGNTVAGQEVYFTSHRVTVPVDLSIEDVERARAEVDATRRTVNAPTAPGPFEDDPRCRGCSHASVCLPEERAVRLIHRRILVGDPDSYVVHLATPGSYACLQEGRVRVLHRGEEAGSIPVERVQGIVVHGNIDLSGALIREMMWRSQAIVWCSGNGRVIGWSTSAASPNGLARVRQHEQAANGRLDLAREFVRAKIANQATLLRRNGYAVDAVAMLRDLQRRAGRSMSLNELLGIEGEAAATYFEAFVTMMRPDLRDDSWARFMGRSGRPARDPLNACLNYAYAMLLADTIRALASCGLDPHAGFLHSSSRNKPALALDLCEEFRAPVADSAVLGAFNNGEVTIGDFTDVLGATRLRDGGRRALIGAYERRTQTVFKHPVFGYQVTWRRAMEVQARMVLGVIDGTQPRYQGIRVR